MTAHLIVLEGLDATGKSTLARILGQRLGAEVLSTPPGALRNVRQHLDRVYQGCDLAAQLFYASTVALVSQEARRLLEAGRHVIIDRYWLSTLVYNALRPGSVKLDCVEPVLHRATLTVVLDAEDQERRRRLEQRGVCTEADRESLSAGHLLREGFARLRHHALTGHMLHLNTTDMPPEQCAQRILKELPQ